MLIDLAVVRFGDGEFRLGWFATDPELLLPLLFDLPDAARMLAVDGERIAELCDLASGAPEPEDVESVEVWVGYGQGCMWKATASRTAGLVTSGLGPLSSLDDDTVERMAPSWPDLDWSQVAEAKVGSRPLSHPMAKSWATLTLEPPRHMPAPLVDDADFIVAVRGLLDGRRDVLQFERVTEGLLLRAGDSPDELGPRLESIVPLARSRTKSWDFMSTFVGAGILELIGEPRNDDHLDFGRMVTMSTEEHRAEFAVHVQAVVEGGGIAEPPTTPLGTRSDHLLDLEVRCSEVIGRLRRREVGPLLSMPTELNGSIDPDVFDARLASSKAMAAAWTYDLRVAEIRAGVRAVDIPALGWADPSTYSSIEPGRPSSMGVLGFREFAMARTTALYAAVYPSMWPHAPEVAASSMLHMFLGDLNRAPSWSSPSILAGAAVWYSTVGVPISAAAAATCGLALAAKSSEIQSAGRQLLMRHHHEPAWALEVGQTIAAAVEAGVAQTRRLAVGVSSLVDEAPATCASLLVGALDRLLVSDASTVGPLMGVCVDAAEHCEFAIVPAGLAELAGSSSRTKLVRDARRLLKQLESQRSSEGDH